MISSSLLYIMRIGFPTLFRGGGEGGGGGVERLGSWEDSWFPPPVSIPIIKPTVHFRMVV